MLEPTITVRVNGAACSDGPTTSRKPVGADWNVRSTVWGCRSTLFVSINPFASVAVNRNSRCDGYS